MKKIFFLITLVHVFGCESFVDQKPNILIFLSDDQGWGDLSFNGNSNLTTPNIDGIANNGAAFDRFYVSPVCSPTRAELLTGKFFIRSGVNGVTRGYERMNLDHSLISDYFKEKYRLKCLRYYENFGGQNMQWHTDNRNYTGKETSGTNIKNQGLIVLAYIEDVHDGEFQYYNTHEISFEGYDRSKTSLSIPDIPFDGVGSSFAAWVPFQAETQIEHHFLSSKEIVWEMITSLEMYNTWFAGIQRAIADVETDRYVHKFSFDKLDLKPGSFFKARPATLAPWFKCRIITVEKEKEFGFDFQMTPFYSEYVSFVLEESKKGLISVPLPTDLLIFGPSSPSEPVPLKSLRKKVSATSSA